jgi:hypothetical protein
MRRERKLTQGIGDFTMFFYSIYQGEYEDYQEIFVYHEKEFTLDEFKEMCTKCKDSSANRIVECLCTNFGFIEVETIHDCGILYQDRKTVLDFTHYFF